MTTDTWAAADLWRPTRRLRRRAREARRAGVALLTEAATGEVFATSATPPRTVHRVSAFSCTCPDFLRDGECDHNALLLESLGYLGMDDEPEPVRPDRAA